MQGLSSIGGPLAGGGFQTLPSNGFAQAPIASGVAAPGDQLALNSVTAAAAYPSTSGNSLQSPSQQLLQQPDGLSTKQKWTIGLLSTAAIFSGGFLALVLINRSKNKKKFAADAKSGEGPTTNTGTSPGSPTSPQPAPPKETKAPAKAPISPKPLANVMSGRVWPVIRASPRFITDRAKTSAYYAWHNPKIAASAAAFAFVADAQTGRYISRPALWAASFVVRNAALPILRYSHPLPLYATFVTGAAVSGMILDHYKLIPRSRVQEHTQNDSEHAPSPDASHNHQASPSRHATSTEVPAHFI